MDFEGDEGRVMNDIDADFLTEQELEGGDQLVPFVDQVIFLVHLHDDLFVEQDDGNSPIKVILQGFISFLKSKIISKAGDKVGLILFNSVIR
jgi:hypothetical protein